MKYFIKWKFIDFANTLGITVLIIVAIMLLYNLIGGIHEFILAKEYCESKGMQYDRVGRFWDCVPKK